MDCPRCGNIMEEEDAPEVRFPKPPLRCTIYRCDECDSEYVDRRGDGFMLLDGSDMASEKDDGTALSRSLGIRR